MSGDLSAADKLAIKFRRLETRIIELETRLSRLEGGSSRPATGAPTFEPPWEKLP